MTQIHKQRKNQLVVSVLTCNIFWFSFDLHNKIDSIKKKCLLPGRQNQKGRRRAANKENKPHKDTITQSLARHSQENLIAENPFQVLGNSGKNFYYFVMSCETFCYIIDFN